MKQQTSDHIFALRDVGFRYPDGSIGLDRCTLAIKRGSRTAVLGANGAGKTTLFLHLNGLLRPRAGTVLYNGLPFDYSRCGLRSLRSRVGLVFQNPDSQLFSASVLEDVSFGPMNLGLDSRTVRCRVAEALEAVGMADCADKPVHNLSYGQKKRICIAGVLAMQPEVMILDEPMAGLDVPMQEELCTILDCLNSNGMTIVIATHDLDFAYAWANTLHLLEGGRSVASWEAESLPEALAQLASFGLAMPRVAELHRILVDVGLLGVSEPLSRSLNDLITRLRAV